MRYFIFVLFVFFLSISASISSQELGSISGTISDTAGYSIGFANIAIQGTKYGATADRFGQYTLQVPAGSNKVVVTCVGYSTRQFEVSVLANEKKKYDFTLDLSIQDVEEVKVSGRSNTSGTIKRIDAKTLGSVPNATGSIENVIKQLPGVASNNELSSQYSVRGGSFDENLVYVNDIEIYRPLLIRSGQQEGLSFINPDMVSSLKFSAGGFDASYGDKMSSVLDVTYKKPTQNTGNFSVSMLGSSLSYEGVSKNGKFRHLSGIRYKTSQYLLSSMDTKGEYSPSFVDAQTYLAYDILPKLEISFLGNYSQNKYEFIPVNRETEFGTYQEGFKLQTYYEGKEKDKFVTAMGAFTMNYHIEEFLSLKLIASAYTISENETFDILGQYTINELDKANQNKDDSALVIGIGSFLNHARNKLNSNIVSISHIGTLNLDKNKLKWGITAQNEIIDDKLNEWELVDSAGYMLPYSEKEITLSNPRHSFNNITSERFSGFLMHTIELAPGNEKLFITSGIRAQYWNLNRQTVFNPRASVSYQPSWMNNLMFYLASGFYNQPAFYKELRNPSGVVNKNLKAQKAIHYVLGADYIFYAFARPFKMTTEIYYKDFDNLVPYKVDNVRTIYAGENMAKGYAKGIDFKLNGEFVKGTESWVSFSLLETKEDIKGDSYLSIKENNETGKNDTSTIYPGYYSRPTDQLVNLSLYFQDYLPRFPSYKVHLSIHYGSRLPVTFPLTNRWDDVRKLLPSYKRVDLGVSKLIKGEEMHSNIAFLNHFKEMWISAEIFNVIGINNTSSYLWVKSVSNTNSIPGYFAVPNYLTGRRINIKLTASF